MFYVNARKEGQSLKIDPDNAMRASIPTAQKRGDMQLFEGKRMSDGSINWVNPQALENYLVSVDIHTLDFYPPLYLDSLQRWGYDIKNKSSSMMD